MEETAHITGDVIDTRCSEDGGDVYFLLEDSTHKYTISLKEVLECLRFAEDECEIEPLPRSFWISAINRYPGMYIGKFI